MKKQRRQRTHGWTSGTSYWAPRNRLEAGPPPGEMPSLRHCSARGALRLGLLLTSSRGCRVLVRDLPSCWLRCSEGQVLTVHLGLRVPMLQRWLT